jgi:antitoxin VapB
MALYIRSEEADQLARELAARLNLTITEAVTVALREKLASTPEPANEERRAAFLAFVKEVQARSAARPVRDDRDHADMLYDENGLPK